jgi:hypothetical protein
MWLSSVMLCPVKWALSIFLNGPTYLGSNPATLLGPSIPMGEQLAHSPWSKAITYNP